MGFSLVGIAGSEVTRLVNHCLKGPRARGDMCEGLAEP